jgi:hypothetical protein
LNMFIHAQPQVNAVALTVAAVFLVINVSGNGLVQLVNL